MLHKFMKILLICSPLITFSCRRSAFNESPSEALSSQMEKSTSRSIQNLLAENTPASRQLITAYLEDFLVDLAKSQQGEPSKTDSEVLRTSAEVLILALQNQGQDLCEENEKIRVFRGLPLRSLSSRNPTEAVILARGFSTIDISFADVMMNYAREVTRPEDFGNHSANLNNGGIKAINPFSYAATSSRHSLAVAPKESPYISVTVFPTIARSFASDDGFVATLSLCPGRLWSTSEGGFAAEGEFLIPFGTLPGEIAAIEKVTPSSTEEIDRKAPSRISKCFFENSGMGDTGLFKATSVQILARLNATILTRAAQNSKSISAFQSIDFNSTLGNFINDECNCQNQVRIFKNLAAELNAAHAKRNLPPTWTPGTEFCQDYETE